MSWIVRLSRACPYCMAFNSVFFYASGAPYSIKPKYNYFYDYYALTRISQVDPLFYHPITKKYIVGGSKDPMMNVFIATFLLKYDLEVTLSRFGMIPFPEEPKIVDINRAIESETFDFVHKMSGALTGVTISYMGEFIRIGDIKNKVLQQDLQTIDRIRALLEKI